MNEAILHTILLATAFLGLFGIGELLFHLFKIRVEITRKLIHLGTGILSLLFPIFLKNHWLVLLLCSSFLILLLLSKKLNLLPSINSIERKSYGSLWYPVSVYLCYLAYEFNNYNIIFFYIPVLILAISDPFAAITGKKWPAHKIGFGATGKTWIGSGFFMVSATIIAITILCLNMPDTSNFNKIIAGLITGFVSATVELYTGSGHDNISIPVSALTCLFILQSINFIQL